VTNVMNLDDVTLGEVMTPRTDMVAVPVTATVEEAKAVMLDEGHLRVPVYEE
jgi:putative hemolysin